jgi:hypothetical protein
MKTTVTLEPTQMTEREAREANERAARHARDMARMRGEGDVSQDAMRRRMQQHADNELRKRQERGE